MPGKRISDVSDLEYVGTLVDTTQSFRPASNVTASELELRRIHRKSTKKYSKMPPIPPSTGNVDSKGDVEKPKSLKAKISQLHPTINVQLVKKRSIGHILREINPKTSADFLRAEEIEMELLNRQREIEYNAAKKLMEKNKPPFHSDRIELMPEQFQEISDDECRTCARDPNKIKFRDSVDVSRDPSYSKFEIPYDKKCLNRYKAMKHKYEMQLRHELEMLQEMQPSAYEAARFAIFLGPQALQKQNYSPRTVKFTPKERKRIQYLLLEEQR